MKLKIFTILTLVFTISCAGSTKSEPDLCGNTILDVGEECEPDLQTNFSCEDMGYHSGTLVCKDDCTFDISDCMASGKCPDGIVNGNEECDGNETVTTTCEQAGYGDGTVSCTASCRFDYSGCSAAPVCGNGEVESPAEECDDQNSTSNDGCTDCLIEAGWACDNSSGASVCMRVPDRPVIEGEESAGHLDLLWKWDLPAYTSYFEYRINGGSETQSSENTYELSVASEGNYVIEVRACNEIDFCSDFASFTTTVEYFGSNLSPAWRGSSRQNLTTSPLGNTVPLSCHNCYNGPSNEVYNEAQALAKISNALTREADLIELDIATDGNSVCVYHGDPSSCSSYPLLEGILSDTTFRSSDAMLFIEIKEGNQPAATFAQMVLDILDANRDYVRNGRPLYFRAFASGIPYLQAIQAALPDYPFIKNYIKFAVLYGQNAYSDVAQFQTQIVSDVAGNGFQMIEFEYRQKHLTGLAAFARSLGLGVGIYTVPGSFGEVFLASLREEVDEITVEYRIDQARNVVEEKNLHAYINTAFCTSASDTTVNVSSNTGTISTSTVAVNTLPTASSYGTPALHFDPQGEDRYGCSLDYRSLAGMTSRALNLGIHTPTPGSGFLITAYVNFDVIGSLTGTMAIINSAEAGGFALELYNDGTSTFLRFGVHVNGSYRYHSYNTSATGLSSPNGSINGSDGYWLVGAYDGDGGVYLWIDNAISGSGGSFTGDVTNPGVTTLGGADPQPADALKARFFFDGLIQQLSVQRWGDHSFTGSVVND